MNRVLPRQPLRIDRVEAFALRSPIEVPVRTSFGVMYDRPAVFVRVTDADGAEGWGEAWCNFPACGAEHRARLVETVMAPLLAGRAFDGPQDAFEALTRATAVLAIQSGEHGPMAQSIAGIDLALWDLSARRAGEPLWRHLGGASGEVGVYASGINPDAPERIAAQRHDDGYRVFKLKVGFGLDRDVANLQRLRTQLGPRVRLMVDANQAWTLDEALAAAPRIAPFDPGWLEEPLRADRPWSEWRTLASACEVPLAAGENVAGDAAFDAAIASGVLRFLQPDVAKWGGISGTWPVVQRAQAAGLQFYPHYLGGGIGLLASAHLLAAAGGDGLLEVDANPNPLRTEVAPLFTRPVDGRCHLGDAPGLGELDACRALVARHRG
jgi:L-alanine-DL-glutamate epimerase-like enolase superfamily enzyme